MEAVEAMDREMRKLVSLDAWDWNSTEEASDVRKREKGSSSSEPMPESMVQSVPGQVAPALYSQLEHQIFGSKIFGSRPKIFGSSREATEYFRQRCRISIPKPIPSRISIPTRKHNLFASE